MSLFFDGHKLKIARVPTHHEGGEGGNTGDVVMRNDELFIRWIQIQKPKSANASWGCREEMGGGEEKRRVFFLMDNNSKSKQR